MNKEGIKAGSSLAIGLFISQFFQLPHGYWILVTITVIYLAGAFNGFKIDRINKRILGTLLGLTIGILLMLCWSYYDYKILYITPFLVFFGTYLYFLSNNYTYVATFISIILLLTISMLAPPNYDWNMYSTAYSRMVCTVIGVLIMLVTEFCFFYKETRAEANIYPILSVIINKFGTLSDELINLFKNNQQLSGEFRAKYIELYKKGYVFKLLLKSLDLESINDRRKIKIYQEIYKDIHSSLDCMREIIFIITHRDNEETQNLLLLEDMRNYFTKEFSLNQPTKSLIQILKSGKNEVRNNGINMSEYCFIQSLYRLNKKLIKVNKNSRLINSK